MPNQSPREIPRAYIPVTVKHDQTQHKSFFFMGDRWHFMGEIKYNFINTSDKSGVMEIYVPDTSLFVDQHKDEGAEDWWDWGPQVN